MGEKVFGVFVLYNKKFPLHEEIDFCFFVARKAIEKKIGIKFWGNVSEQFRIGVENLQEKIPFELLDNPMKVDAECLFVGDGVKVCVDGTRVDAGESLKSRMLRVQDFLDEVLKTKSIKEIVLDINIENKEHIETVDVRVNNFCSKMLKLYEQNNNRTPIIRVFVK